jgi:sugar phosphate isomerase/epimerase
MDLAIQLHTLRTLEEPWTETITRLADTPYEAVQFCSGFEEEDPAEIADALDAADLAVAGAHVGVDDVDEPETDAFSFYRSLGIDDLVVSSYGREAFETAEGARQAGEHLAAIADRLADRGVRLHYHNHAYEFTDLGDRSAFDVFAASATGVGLEIDTGLASHGGADPVELFERYGDRVDLVHLTDSRAGSEDTLHMDLGTGEVDVEGCVTAAADAGASWLIFEHGLTDDPTASMDAAAETLVPLLS